VTARRISIADRCFFATATVRLCQPHTGIIFFGVAKRVQHQVLMRTELNMNLFTLSKLLVQALLSVLIFCLLPSSSKAEPSIFERLDHVREPQISPASNKQDAAILSRVATLPAKQIIPHSKHPDYEPIFEVAGTLNQYITSVVSSDGKAQTNLTTVGFVSCSGNLRHRCAAVAGNYCLHSKSEACEGMALLVAVDITNGYTFDRAIGGGNYLIKTLEDLEELRIESP
jgi:hypothetical protein